MTNRRLVSTMTFDMDILGISHWFFLGGKHRAGCKVHVECHHLFTKAGVKTACHTCYIFIYVNEPQEHEL